MIVLLFLPLPHVVVPVHATPYRNSYTEDCKTLKCIKSNVYNLLNDYIESFTITPFSLFT